MNLTSPYDPNPIAPPKTGSETAPCPPALERLGYFFDLLSDGDHLALICSLYQGPKTAQAIATELNFTPTQTTQILSQLVQAAIIHRTFRR